jgi:hypothetical protein
VIHQRLLPGLTAILLTASGFLSVPAAAPAESPAPHLERVAMRDGVRLATDVYLPGTNAAWPVILARTPYSRRVIGGFATDGLRRGYAIVVQDVRGRFDSEGENLPFDRDRDDGADTVAWLARQPWCNGHIGTWGGSAGAITQLQLASSGTPHLDCMHLVVGAPSQYLDLAYSGGVFRKALVEDWIRATRFASNALPRWVAHPTFDAFWKERDAALRYSKVHSPAVHIGGYWDIFAQGTLDAFNGYQTRGSGLARGHQKLVMGPWTHGVLSEKAGDLRFPGAKKPPGGVHDAWRWYDHWLKGETNGIDALPAVTYYVIGDVNDPAAPGNVWRTASAWPPVPTAPQSWFLHEDHSFSISAPRSDGALSYTYDPTNPVPTMGGIQLTIPAGPKDQQSVESRPDVLVFTSEVLPEPVEVTGRVGARLWVSSDAPDTDFFVTLCDVYPDGKSYNLCEGRLRARFRDGFEQEKLLKPGRVYHLDVDLWSTSVVFNRGHRLRVHVTSSSAPGFDPNPNTGARFRADAITRPARNTVFLSPGRPSQLILPVAATRAQTSARR